MSGRFDSAWQAMTGRREVEEKLAWSLERISGRLRLEATVSHEWICKHAWKGGRRNAAPAGAAARSAARTPGGRRVVASDRVDIRPGEEKSRVGD